MIRTLVATLAVATCAFGGMAAGLYIGGDTDQETSFARLHTSVTPTLDGNVSIFVPLVDWRVGLLRHAAPADVSIELRGVDRTRVGAGLSSSDAANASLETIRVESTRVVERAIRRGVLAAGIGGLAGSVIGGLLVTTMFLRRRWFLGALVVGATITVVVVGGSARTLASLDERDFQPSAASGNAEELPYVLRFAQQLLYVGDDYERHYATALASVENLVEFSGSGSGATIDRSVFVVSDIHDNVFVLDALDELAGDDTVFALGDFVQVGAAIEERTAPRIAELGGSVVAISGNHDSTDYMEQLAKAGATVLAEDRDDDADDVTDIDGLRVAAWPDPLERQPGAGGAHVLRVYDEAYEEQVADFIEWFDALEEWPDVVLVHQHGFAHRLANHHARSGDPRRLQLFTGHDHRAHVEQEDNWLIVDGGTLGAGGFAAIGEQDASFARVHFSGAQVSAVDIVSVEPLTGRASAERTRITPAS
jgi:predicted phosphodiesterase